MTRGKGRTVYHVIRADGQSIGEWPTYTEAALHALQCEPSARVKAVHVDDADAEPKPEERKP